MLIKPENIMESLKNALLEQFPQESVYENLVPKNFSRPSNLVELSSIRVTGIKNSIVTLQYTYRITDFVSVDERRQSDTALLDLRTVTIVGWIFGKGYLSVGDRAMTVESVSTEHNFDYTVTTAVLSLTYDRSEFAPASVLPLMEQLQLKEAFL